eukprot:Lithocolla_globosa_v1_NODE_1289_length_2697_cov_19.253217.p1 type:complete len:226 gc:universal NODE_1289_length_2697_cov_19.253217:2365-1688(-)
MNMSPETNILRFPVNRANQGYSYIIKTLPEMFDSVVEYVRKWRSSDQQVMIFGFTYKRCDQLKQKISMYGSTEVFKSDLSKVEKENILENWMSANLKQLVGTTASTTGLDNEKLNCVLLFIDEWAGNNIPDFEFVQAASRGGRLLGSVANVVFLIEKGINFPQNSIPNKLVSMNTRDSCVRSMINEIMVARVKSFAILTEVMCFAIFAIQEMKFYVKTQLFQELD